jgi:magnesium-transporting ATPase (P-type)
VSSGIERGAPQGHAPETRSFNAHSARQMAEAPPQATRPTSGVPEHAAAMEAAGLPAGAAAPPRPWHTLEAGEALELLGSDPEGISEEDAARRLEALGPNEVEAERVVPWWELVAHQFRDPLIYILLIAAAVTLVLREFTDAGVIITVVLINALIGFVQERRAQQAMQALARMSAPRAEVLRGGATHEIASRELVPGDVVVLTSGVRVPADLRLLHVRELEADESALTGESMPVRKNAEALEDDALVAGDQVNMVFAGTVVTRGRGRGVVVRTALRTELGRIASAVREIGLTRTPLQEGMDRFGRLVGLAIVGFSLLVVVVGLLRAMPPGEIFLAAVATAVAAIPEGLPVVLTVTLAIGVSRMARRNAIIRSLPAVETLGSTTVIGSDKTGTLTKNQMTVRAAWADGRRYDFTGVGYGAEGAVEYDGREVEVRDHAALCDALLAGVLANEADPASALSAEPGGDPTEIALHVAAAKAGLHPRAVRGDRPELDVLPFESEQRYMATLNEGPEGRRAWLKGAPEALLERCGAQAGERGAAPLDAEAVRRAAEEMAAEGLRVLAMAYRPTEAERLEEGVLDRDLVFAGLQGLEDPVRPEAVEAVAAAHEAGIRVLMLTGDHVDTARAIGRQLGLGEAGGAALEGRTIETMSEEELDEAVRAVDVYARMEPEHKLRVVRRLRAQGEVVAVTGDGVNDAPALRAAHLGIAMGKGGTDVAREASGMVLADDNFATITAAVEEGRVVYSNVRKVTFFLLSTGVGQIAAILAALAVGWPLPFVAAQILWINLVTNGLQDVALAFEPGEPGLLKRRPRPPREGVLTLRLAERLGGVGGILAAGTLWTFWWTLEQGADVDGARTAAMTQMVVFQFFHVLNSRSLDRSIFRVPPLSNPFLFASLVAAAVAHALVLYLPFLQAVFRTSPLRAEQWLMIVAVGSTVIVGGELDKWRNRRLGRTLG